MTPPIPTTAAVQAAWAFLPLCLVSSPLPGQTNAPTHEVAGITTGMTQAVAESRLQAYSKTLQDWTSQTYTFVTDKVPDHKWTTGIHAEGVSYVAGKPRTDENVDYREIIDIEFYPAPPSEPTLVTSLSRRVVYIPGRERQLDVVAKAFKDRYGQQPLTYGTANWWWFYDASGKAAPPKDKCRNFASGQQTNPVVFQYPLNWGEQSAGIADFCGSYAHVWATANGPGLTSDVGVDVTDAPLRRTRSLALKSFLAAVDKRGQDAAASEAAKRAAP